MSMAQRTSAAAAAAASEVSGLKQSIRVAGSAAGMGRLDAAVLKLLKLHAQPREGGEAQVSALWGSRWSRPDAAQLVRLGGVSVAGQVRTKPGLKVGPGDVLEVTVEVEEGMRAALGESGDISTRDCSINLAAEPGVTLDVLYEDDHVCVLNKQPGVAVHPSPGQLSGTLVNGLLHRFGRSGLSGENRDGADPMRPGIVHRLDKDTSGVMIVARTNEAHSMLQRQFASHGDIRKVYQAIVVSTQVDGDGSTHRYLDAPAGTAHKCDTNVARHTREINKMVADPSGTAPNSKTALTQFRVLETWRVPGNARAAPADGKGGRRKGKGKRPAFERFARLEVEIFTGRTHQIRVHLSSLGLPIVGDPIYHPRSTQHPRAPTLMLAARTLRLRIPLPSTRLDIEAVPAASVAKAVQSPEGVTPENSEFRQFDAPEPTHMSDFAEFLTHHHLQASATDS